MQIIFFSMTQPDTLEFIQISDQICVICTEDIQNDISFFPVCKHVFHKMCLKMWFYMGNTTCPCCRRKFVNENQIVNFFHSTLGQIVICLCIILALVLICYMYFIIIYYVPNCIPLNNSFTGCKENIS